MRRLACPSLALSPVVLVILIAGCGGGDEGTGSSDTTTSTQKQLTTAKSQAAKKQSAEEMQAKKSGDENAAKPAQSNAQSAARDIPVGEPVPGSKAVAPGVPTVKGGDNSIQAFGTEGEEGPREQAVANLIAYTNARLAGEWGRACELASPGFRKGLAQLTANPKGKDKPEGCAETLALFTSDRAKAAIREKSRVSEVLSFRIEDPYAYLIFKGAEGKVRFVAMESDDGEWRVNVLEPEAFVVGTP